MIRRRARAALAALAYSSTFALTPPKLDFVAPPALSPLAARLEAYDPERMTSTMRLVGLSEPGPPIRVILAEEGSREASAVPRWAGGYASGIEGAIVLIPARAPSYPYGSLQAVLQHEIAHVLIDRAAAGGPVPRWFHEGTAMAAARGWSISDRARLIVEILPGREITTAQLDLQFEGGEGEVHGAYTLAGAFMRDLLDRHGPRFPGAVLARVARGEGFEEAFQAVTGQTTDEAAAGFQSRQNFWNRWIPFLASSFTVWTVISLLALWAIRKRRRRDALRREEWALEEALREIYRPGKETEN